MRAEAEILLDIERLMSVASIDYDSMLTRLDEVWPVRTWATIPVLLCSMDRCLSSSCSDGLWVQFWARLQDFVGWECFLLDAKDEVPQAYRRLHSEISDDLRDMLSDQTRRKNLLECITKSATASHVVDEIRRHTRTPMPRDLFFSTEIPPHVDVAECRRIELTLAQALLDTKSGEIWGSSVDSSSMWTADPCLGFHVISKSLSFAGSPDGSRISLGLDDREAQKFCDLAVFVLNRNEWHITKR